MRKKLIKQKAVRLSVDNVVRIDKSTTTFAWLRKTSSSIKPLPLVRIMVLCLAPFDQNFPICLPL